MKYEPKTTEWMRRCNWGAEAQQLVTDDLTSCESCLAEAEQDITEPEDIHWHRELKPIHDELNNLHQQLATITQERDALKRIIDDTLREVPVGNVNAHIPENLPMDMEYYVQETVKQDFEIERLEKERDALLKELAMTRIASAIFEQNSENCVVEFEGRLKAEKERDELLTAATKYRDKVHRLHTDVLDHNLHEEHVEASAELYKVIQKLLTPPAGAGNGKEVGK